MTRPALATLLAAAALAVGVLAVPAGAAACEAAPVVGYDGAALSARLRLDVTACHAVGRTGTITVRLWMNRYDAVTGTRTTTRRAWTRCRNGARSCSVQARWPHPATERARYDVYAAYDTTGRVVLAGASVDRQTCTSVAGEAVECLVPA
jgi:hypothetical protein